MTFSYDLTDGLSDIDRVRLWTGDTVEAAAMYSDEELSALIAEEGSWQAAVVAALEAKIAELALVPDFKADWLEVDVKTTVTLLNGRLARFQAKHADVFNDNGGIGSEAVHVYRGDSDATEAPSY